MKHYECFEGQIKETILQEIENEIDKYLKKHKPETINEINVTIHFQRLETITASTRTFASARVRKKS